MLATSNLSIQFGAKPLFEQVTVKFSDGNRYGLIGANGSGKSTLMKVLGGEIDQSTGDVMLQAGLRMGKLNQNQFAYEDERVLDVVMQGHVEMWKAMRERDAIYANPDATTPSRRSRPVDFSTLRPDLPAWLQATLAHAIAIDPARRFHDMTEFALEMEAGPARAPTVNRRPRTLYERAPTQVWQGVAALLALALLASLLVR